MSHHGNLTPRAKGKVRIKTENVQKILCVEAQLPMYLPLHSQQGWNYAYRIHILWKQPLQSSVLVTQVAYSWGRWRDINKVCKERHAYIAGALPFSAVFGPEVLAQAEAFFQDSMKSTHRGPSNENIRSPLSFITMDIFIFVCKWETERQ